MLTSLRTPGAYYQAVDAGGPEVSALRTDITGFAGIAGRGPLDLPVPVQSWRQFVSWFGDVTPVGYLAYAVRAFFENGGARCWVVRVASADPAAGAACAAIEISGPGGPGAARWRVRAATEGGWGNRLTLSVREVNRVQVKAIGHEPAGSFSTVTSVSGLVRATHVRVSQPGRPPVWKVVADVDATTQRIWWVRTDGPRLPIESPLHGLDLGAPALVESIEYRIVVSESDRLVAMYDGLSLIPESDGYGPLRLGPVRAPVDPLTRAAAWAPPQPVVVEDLRDATIAPDLTGLQVDPDASLVLSGGRSGLALLEPRDFYGEPVAPDDGPVAAAYKRRGIRAFEDVAEIALLAVPDALIHPAPVNPTAPPPDCVSDPCLDPPAEPFAVQTPSDTDQPPVFTDAQVFQVQSAMVDQCERLRYRFALLDPPLTSATDAAAGLSEVLDWRSRFDTSFAALTYPWLAVLDPLHPGGGQRLVPPSGHTAGAYAATDLQAGVHRAPANRRLAWALAASADVDEARHAILNDADVNTIRSVGARGPRVLGARTVCSDPDWRFVNVRRLMSMVEKALEVALQWAVFEPNGVLTRARATMSVTIFLLGLQEAGMLAGATPEESFYVRCDLDNNPAQERDLGRMIIEIGVAPALPFEFVVMRVGRVRDSLEVRELGPSSAVGGAR